ncbi:hypothetical protein ACLEIY_10400 [Acetobacter tropicalis]|uniref:hypothetical protein n=1 Tax=Acetobacter TaxID=434 RepID=UPI001E396D22|nr:hypothetical protein [Acetobacter senegalensis]MCP1196231.1 hypothetical protein [Acetobacter senegalensis]MDN7350469.1 hypothetical protein [Acetobacter senegalensis]
MGETLPDLMTIKDVLSRLKGKIGRSRLVKHLHETPEYNGGPTHRKWGAKYLFSAQDYERLIESIECPSSSSKHQNRKTCISAALSPAKAYSKALERLTEGSQRKSGASAKRNSGTKQFMGSVQS